QLLDGNGTVEVADHPAQQRFERLRGVRLRQRGFDVLRLAAFAVRWRNHAAGQLGRDPGAVLPAYQVQAEVDAGRGTRAREDRSVVDVKGIRVDDRGREPPGELLGVAPVRRTVPAVE